MTNFTKCTRFNSKCITCSINFSTVLWKKEEKQQQLVVHANSCMETYEITSHCIPSTRIAPSVSGSKNIWCIATSYILPLDLHKLEGTFCHFNIMTSNLQHCLRTSPTPIGCTPGHLSTRVRWHARRAHGLSECTKVYSAYAMTHICQCCTHVMSSMSKGGAQNKQSHVILLIPVFMPLRTT